MNGFRRILSVAANTFRETVRNKILYVLLAFALVLIGITGFLADLSVGDLSRIIADMGLACVHVFGVIIAVFVGITLISQEVERKTVYLILYRPVRRWEFLLGKTLGLCGTLAVVAFVMALTVFVVHFGYGGAAEPGILVAAGGIYLELVVLTALATFFSSFTTPVLSATFTLALILVGHVSRDLLVFGGRSGRAAVRWTAAAVYYALPNLEHFNFKNDVAHGMVRSPAVLLFPLSYMLLYAAAVLVLACLLFSRKDFK